VETFIYLLLLLINIIAESFKHNATILWNRLPNLLKKPTSIKNYSKSQVLFAVSKLLLLELVVLCMT